MDKTEQQTEQTTEATETTDAKPARKPRTLRSAEDVLRSAYDKKQTEVIKLEARLNQLDTERGTVGQALRAARQDLTRYSSALAGQPAGHEVVATPRAAE